jgi:hypothetical protein
MRSTQRSRFSLVPLPGGRRAPDRQIHPETIYRQIGCQFQEKRHIPFTATDHEKRHGRNTVWELRAREAPEHIKANWPSSAWIVEMITDTLSRKGKRSVR